jgi:mRNA-degrading endonuclease RelE of RelBE toxin-antitoxin system
MASPSSTAVVVPVLSVRRYAVSHRLRVGPYRVLYEVEGDLITIVRIDRV